MFRYLLPALFVTACASTPTESVDPAVQADVCEVLSLPGSPGFEDTQDLDQRDRAWVIEREVKDGWSGWEVENRRGGASGPWGRCPGQSAAGIDSIAFSEGRKYAKTFGGWQAAPLSGGWGYCLSERKESGWEPVVCQVTLVS